MRRLRTTFTRSRTPTGADMKTQSSLEVPKQVRSASFDEIQLEAQRALQSSGGSDESGSAPSSGFLRVPQCSGQRSRSFDSAAVSSDDSVGSFLEVPRRFQRRRSSNSNKTPPPCLHCQYAEEYARQVEAAGGERYFIDHHELRALSYSSDTDSSTTDDEDEDSDHHNHKAQDDHETNGSPLLCPPSPCNITFTLSPTIQDDEYPPFPLLDTASDLKPYPPSPTIELPPEEGTPPVRTRRRSISRQEAFVVEPTGNSLENVAASDESATSSNVPSEEVTTELDSGLVVRDIYLAVPDLKRDRAASVDSCFSKVSSAGKTQELQPPDGGLLCLEVPPSGALRSRSVDIVLPTDEQARYKALALAGPQSDRTDRRRKASGDGSTGRSIRGTPDWGEAAVSGEHMWQPTSVSGDYCYLADNDCTKHGPRLKCSACKVIAHAGCLSALAERARFQCKPTFRDVGVRQYREQTCTHHHWVHRRTEKGKCRQCGKSLQAKLSFSSKEIVALSCSWCKAAYHNKESCFNIQRIGEECSLGNHGGIIVPPSWIVKLPRRGSFKSSLRKTPKKKTSSKKRSKDKPEKDPKTFVIKPIPSTTVTPVLVFINPRSGGNQGGKLLQKFQWLLNPRQVFDLTQGGPKMGLELFRKVPNLRVLACGGDGTVGWVLSVLDQIGVVPPPAVGVLPLGTGNDLARALGWGGGYTDEPISKILGNIGESDTVLLDRWQLKVVPNTSAEPNEEGKENLPLNVVNNYFSLGVDAHIALEFHEAREARPEKFNSRLRNKMFYGQAGGKDLLRRKWKGLAEFVTLECDGKDMTPKLKEHKVHAIVFLNIPSYGGGTHPWNKSGGTYEPMTDDGLIEVVGLTTYQLPLLQAGGHGTCITQCRSARIVTSKTIPMQVDGEACKLMPSVIQLTLLNKALMLAKRRPGRTNVQQTSIGTISVNVDRITMADYEQHHYDKDLLKQAATNVGALDVSHVADLEQVRTQINKLLGDSNDCKLSSDWCFVDSCTAERFFRVDRAQEHLHYLSDVAAETLYILDSDTGPNLPQTPEDELTFASSITGERGPLAGSLSESSDRESREDTPPSPHVFSRNVSNSTATPDSLSPGTRSPERQSQCGGTTPSSHCSGPVPTRLTSQGSLEGSAGSSQGSQEGPPSQDHQLISSPRNLEYEGLNFKSGLLEKNTDAVLKAAKSGDLNLIKEMHSQGYSLLTIDATGQTALHYSCRFGHKDVIKFLIAYAPTSIMNMADNDKGQTALHVAAAQGRRSICCLLVAGGASPILRDQGGRTPKALALLADDTELAAYLESQEQFHIVTEDSETVV